MNHQFILFRRAGVFYCEDTHSGKQTSLRTKDRAEAQTLLHAKNEATRQPHLNRQIARAYWMGTDALATARTWQHVLDEMIRLKTGANRARWQVAANSKAFDPLRRLLLIETQAENLLRVLEGCKVSTNVYLRRLHNFALDMNWLPCSIIPRRQWPPVQFKEKRAITSEEHQRILAAERNPERRVFYEVCWHLGGSQGDLAQLRAEDIDWENRTVSFFRHKTGTVALQHLGPEAMRLLADAR